MLKVLFSCQLSGCHNPAQFIRGVILVIGLCRYYIKTADLGDGSVKPMLLATAEAFSPLVLHDGFLGFLGHSVHIHEQFSF